MELSANTVALEPQRKMLPHHLESLLFSPLGLALLSSKMRPRFVYFLLFSTACAERTARRPSRSVHVFFPPLPHDHSMSFFFPIFLASECTWSRSVSGPLSVTRLMTCRLVPGTNGKTVLCAHTHRHTDTDGHQQCGSFSCLTFSFELCELSNSNRERVEKYGRVICIAFLFFLFRVAFFFRLRTKTSRCRLVIPV